MEVLQNSERVAVRLLNVGKLNKGGKREFFTKLRMFYLIVRETR